MRDLTKESVEQFLSYDPETGIFTWKIARGRCKAGDVAGCDSGRGYALIRVLGKMIYAHRLAFLFMAGRFPDLVDHIDGVRSNNRWANLREASPAQNSQNMALPSTNKSGVMGVFWNADKQKWTAKIKVAQRSHHLGHFDSLDDAATARIRAEEKFHFHQNHGRRSA